LWTVPPPVSVALAAIRQMDADGAAASAKCEHS